MSKEEQLNEIVNKVQDLSTEQIAEAFFEKDNHGHFRCPWPEHNDKNGSSFLLNKNHTFKCFSCGNRPVFSIHDYLKRVYGIDDIKQSCLYIAFQCNLIMEDEYLELKTFQNKAKTKMNIGYKTRAEKESVKLQPLDIDTLHNIYSIFCLGKSLSIKNSSEIEIKPNSKLDTEHYEYLKNERLLSNEEIEKYGYFTYPKYTFAKPFFKKMEQLNYSIDTLIRVPGLFYNKEKKAMNTKVYRNKSYLGIPIMDEYKKIRGIQLRADKVEDGQSRYIWVSSANMDEKKFLGNLSPNSPIDVVYPNINNPKTIAITEGHFKAVKIANTLNMIALSVQGVNNWKNILQTIENLKKMYPHIKDVIIMYDADMSYKLQVLESAIAVSINILKFNTNNLNFKNYMKAFEVKKNDNGNFNFKCDGNKNITSYEFIKARNELITELRNFHSDLNVNICVWDYTYGKGFDDFLINTNNLDGLIYLPFSEFMYKLSFILEDLLNSENVSQEYFFSLFREYFLTSYNNFEIKTKIKNINCKTDKTDNTKDKGGYEIVTF